MKLSEKAIVSLLQQSLPKGKPPILLRQVINTIFIPALEAELEERGIPFPQRVRHEDGQRRLYTLFEKFVVSELSDKEFTLVIEDNTIHEILIVPGSENGIISSPSFARDTTRGDRTHST